MMSYIYVDFREVENPGSTGKINYEELEPPETQTRFAFVSGVRYNGQTACITHAFQTSNDIAKHELLITRA